MDGCTQHLSLENVGEALEVENLKEWVNKMKN